MPHLALAALSLVVQTVLRPAQHWETVRTTHFTVHYPASARAWSLDIARRLESVRLSVDSVVGGGPRRRVTVLIDDPYSSANGFALPFLDAPTIVLFDAPPEPSEDIGNYRDWGQTLITHEYTHIAHLTMPSRNPWEQLLTRLSPAQISPIAAESPRWVIEGYATYVEGRVTGDGRPHSAARAAILRIMALEGRLPTYGQLDGSPRFEGGELAYLAGSAYLEWLASTHGDSTLPHVWRRMTARRERTFGEAFMGVYGESPDELYGRFTVELTRKALEAQAALAASGIDTGETFQRTTWYTGAPTVSANGRLIAIPLRARGKSTRIVVSTTAAWAGADTTIARQRRELLEKDPRDVPAIDFGPPRRHVIAQLTSAHNRGFDEPRFIGRDSVPSILVSRLERRADGAFRRDLFLWSLRQGTVRRVTYGAGVHAADPSRDGRTAAAVRCHDGVCDLVSVSLVDGSVHLLRAGSPDTTYDGPRLGADGHTIAVAMHDGHSWSIILVDSTVHRIGPDDRANRYDPVFTPDGRSVIAVSEAGGVEHLEIIDLATNTTRIVAAGLGVISSPAASDSTVYFLTTHSTGRVVQKAVLSTAREGTALAVPDTLAPVAVPAPVTPVTISQEPVQGPYAYGIQPRGYRLVGGGAFAARDRFVTVGVASSDPAGRLGWVLQGSLGDRPTWRGVSLGAAWRGWPVEIDGQIFGTWDNTVEYHGLAFAASLPAAGSWHVDEYRLGFSAGKQGAAGRTFAFASAATNADATTDDRILGWGGTLSGATGRTDGGNWARLLGTVRAHIGTRDVAALGTFAAGIVNHAAPAYEQFVLGGVQAPLTDSALLTQRIVDPALPFGITGGRYLLHYRFATAGIVPVSFYFEGTQLDRWHRVYGAELRYVVPPLGFVRVPGVDATAGAGYSIDDPYKYKLRGYLVVRYTP
ncbi:MAG TPA: hypothetical protein VFA43_09990 [Gemmatimonadaceae bacterium]|nr:hypothetical protein [Gemmatimonadaceae bacterium]